MSIQLRPGREALAAGGRQGLGLLPIVVFVAVIIAVLAFQHAQFSIQMTVDLRAVERDQACTRLARAAVENGLYVLQRQALDRTSPLAGLLLKRPLPVGVQTLFIASTDLTAFEELRRAQPGLTLSNDRIAVAVRIHQFDGPAGTERWYERHGTVTLSAELRSTEGGAAGSGRFELGRRSTLSVPFRSLLLATPRPFDRITLGLVNPRGLIDSPVLDLIRPGVRDANWVLDRLVFELRERERIRNGDLDDLIASLRDRAEAWPPDRPGCEAQIAQITSLKEYLELPIPVEGLKASWPTDDTMPVVHHFGWDALLYSMDPEVDLVGVNLPRTLKRDTVDLPTIRADYRRWEGRLGVSVRATQRAVAAIKKYFDALNKILDDFRRFQNGLTERAGNEYRAFEPSLKRALSLEGWLSVTPAQPWPPAFAGLAGLMTLGGSPRGSPKVTRRVGGGDELSKLVAGPRAHHGIVLVESGQPVTLTGTVKGAVVVVCPGALRIENVTSPGQLTVVCFGPLTVKGSVEASLLACGQVELVDPRIHGALLLTNEAFRGARPVEEVLAGTVKPLERFRTGPDPVPRQLKIIFSPTPVRSEVVRL
ncbi:MAG: hypothetical protein HY815_07815 [Candidatus Riflebacteria bacterium]|nr:hypothetical protein [Candidatus Riflebacteria bacterium]